MFFSDPIMRSGHVTSAKFPGIVELEWAILLPQSQANRPLNGTCCDDHEETLLQALSFFDSK